MVLARDVATSGRQVERRDIVRPVPVLELDGPRTGRQRQQLMAQADSHHGHLRRVHHLSQMIHRVLAVSRIARTVRAGMTAGRQRLLSPRRAADETAMGGEGERQGQNDGDDNGGGNGGTHMKMPSK